MVKNALVRALTRVLVLVFAPQTSRTVPIKEIVGERARRSGSGSPFSLLVLFQWRRVNEAATAAEEAAVNTPWRTRTTWFPRRPWPTNSARAVCRTMLGPMSL